MQRAVKVFHMTDHESQPDNNLPETVLLPRFYNQKEKHWDGNNVDRSITELQPHWCSSCFVLHLCLISLLYSYWSDIIARCFHGRGLTHRQLHQQTASLAQSLGGCFPVNVCSGGGWSRCHGNSLRGGEGDGEHTALKRAHTRAPAQK